MSDLHAAELPVVRGQLLRRAIFLLLACVLLAWAARSESLHAAMLQLLAECEAVIAGHALLGAFLFVLAAALSAMLAFISAAVLVPVAVFTWGEPVTIALLWCGWWLGGVVAYCIGRWFGRPVVRWLAAGETLSRLEATVGRSTPVGLVFLFQLALPSEVPGYVLGLVRYRPALYLASLAAAELPYALATVHLGASFVERRSVSVLMMGLALASVSVVAFLQLRKRLVARQGR